MWCNNTYIIIYRIKVTYTLNTVCKHDMLLFNSNIIYYDILLFNHLGQICHANERKKNNSTIFVRGWRGGGINSRFEYSLAGLTDSGEKRFMTNAKTLLHYVRARDICGR